MNTAKHYKIRPACNEDAHAIARLIDIAGEGIPNLLWSNMAEPGQSALDVGRARVCCEVGGLSYRNALVAEVGGSVVGMLLGYILELHERDTTEDPARWIDFAQPIVAQMHQPVGPFYIDALAVFPEWRGCGVGSRLLMSAEQRARNLGVTNMSIQLRARNKCSANLYGRLGYEFSAPNTGLPPHCQLHNTGDVEFLFKAL